MLEKRFLYYVFYLGLFLRSICTLFVMYKKYLSNLFFKYNNEKKIRIKEEECIFEVCNKVWLFRVFMWIFLFLFLEISKFFSV